MKKSKLFLKAGCFICLTFLLSNSSFAEENGRYCSGAKVLLSGAGTTQKLVLLQHQRTDCGQWPPNTPRWFALDESGNNGNPMLAAAFTAHASGKTLTVAPNDAVFGLNAKLIQVFLSN